MLVSFIFSVNTSSAGINTNSDNINTNSANIASLLGRLDAAEANLQDLTDSALATCTTLDLIADPNYDCCMSGADTLPYGDRDRFVCLPRAIATLLGVNTGTSCQVCPAGVFE